MESLTCEGNDGLKMLLVFLEENFHAAIDFLDERRLL